MVSSLIQQCLFIITNAFLCVKFEMQNAPLSVYGVATTEHGSADSEVLVFQRPKAVGLYSFLYFCLIPGQFSASKHLNTCSTQCWYVLHDLHPIFKIVAAVFNVNIHLVFIVFDVNIYTHL